MSFKCCKNPASFDEDEAPQIQYRHLVGGDGQELRSSYRRGDHNRKDKGAQSLLL